MRHLSIIKHKVLDIILAASLTAALALTSFSVIPARTDAATSLCSFNFSISDGPATAKDLNDTYNTNADTGYSAGSGALSADSVFYASIADPEANNLKKLEWSKASSYSYNNTLQPATPIIAASTKNTWGTSPFFMIKTSSKGYESLKVSFRIGASKKGPKNYKVQYSTNGSTYTDISGSAISLSTNKTLYDKSVSLPSAANNAASLYIRIIASSTTTVEGGATTTSASSGEIAINNISLSGTAAKQTTPTPKPTQTSQTKATPKPTGKATAKPAGNTTAKPSGSSSQQTGNKSSNNNSTSNSISNKDSDKNSGGSSNNSATGNQSVKRKIKTLKLTSYKRKAKFISGKSIMGAKIYVTVGSKSYKAVVSKKGTFKIKLAKKLKKGNVIKVYATKTGFTQSKTKSYTVK